ncbi:MAG: hypothetical protein WC480_00550 [Patescibacteria group bacterium]
MSSIAARDTGLVHRPHELGGLARTLIETNDIFAMVDDDQGNDVVEMPCKAEDICVDPPIVSLGDHGEQAMVWVELHTEEVPVPEDKLAELASQFNSAMMYFIARHIAKSRQFGFMTTIVTPTLSVPSELKFFPGREDVRAD